MAVRKGMLLVVPRKQAQLTRRLTNIAKTGLYMRYSANTCKHVKNENVSIPTFLDNFADAKVNLEPFFTTQELQNE